MSWFNFQPQNDMDRGRQAIVYFHNDSVGKPGYDETLDTLLDKVGRLDYNPDSHPEIFLDSFGFAMSAIDMSDSQVQQAMGALADQAGGRIPKQAAFFKALSDRASNLTAGDYISALPGIAADSAVDIAKGAQAVGDSVIATGKSLTQILPIVVVGAVLFIVFSRTRMIAGR